MEEPTREMEKETGAENDLPETEPAAEQEEAKKAAEAKEAEAAEETAEDGKERKFFKKKKDKKDEKIEELTDRLTRQMAEFDNFRKRTEKEKANMYAIGAKDIIEKILPVVDSFERGLATVENPEEDPFADGMNKVYKQFTTDRVRILQGVNGDGISWYYVRVATGANANKTGYVSTGCVTLDAVSTGYATLD